MTDVFHSRFAPDGTGFGAVVGACGLGVCGRAADLATFPYYSWHHGVVVPQGHALAASKKVSLEAIAEFPLITYHQGLTGRRRIDEAYSKASIEPEIVMEALDADVIKGNVELGLGIIASMASEQERDSGLALLDAKHLFDMNTSLFAAALTFEAMPTTSSNFARPRSTKRPFAPI